MGGWSTSTVVPFQQDARAALDALRAIERVAPVPDYRRAAPLTSDPL